MSRLGMLYALEDGEVEKLRSMPEGERYDYMLNVIEEALFGTSRSCELDKAWEGIQYCLGGGLWREENRVPFNVVYGGELLADEDDDVITLKTQRDVEKITAFLRENDLEKLIRENFWKIEDENFRYKDENGLDHTLGWSGEILSFYENALKNGHQVIFTVDF